jgi:hypothetical protein
MSLLWPELSVHPGAIPSEQLEPLAQSLLASPLVSRSTLAGSFRMSRGFALTFRREAVGRVKERLPAASAFLDLTLGSTALLAPRLLGRLFRKELAGPNAFYLNLLLVEDGAGVGRHVDATLGVRETGGEPVTPVRVSVLYLQAPEAEGGGQLRLYRGRRLVQEITPAPGTLLHFRGDLAHEVVPLRGARGVRASLVLEQYRLEGPALEQIPDFHLQSNAPFSAYLTDHRRS